MNYLKNSKLIASLEILSKKELKSFVKWVESPWCNSNRKLEKLLDLVLENFPDCVDEKYTKEYMFQRLYPEKSFNDRWLRNMMAELNKQVEAFLIHEQLRLEQNTKQLLLAKSYEQREEKSRLMKLSVAINEDLKNREPKTWEDYHLGVTINELVYYQSGSSAPFGENLYGIDRYLDQYYQLGKWKIAAEIKSRSKIVNEKYSISIHPNSLPLGEFESENATIQLYKFALKEESVFDSREFTEIKNLFFSNIDQIAEKDKKILFGTLLNLIIRINNLKGGLDIDMAEMYISGFESNLLKENNIISTVSFSNFVNVCTKAYPTNKIKQLVKKYLPFILKIDQSDFKNWSEARIFFEENEFALTIEKLITHVPKNKFLKRISRILLLQSYFEHMLEDGSYYDLFLDYANACLRHYHRNKTQSERIKVMQISFAKYTIKLGEILQFHKKDHSKLRNIAETFQQESHIYGRHWLAEKIENAQNK